jgi:hypothetical protein
MNFDAVLTIIVLMLIGAIFFGPWQELVTAYARQIAFESRDHIFDLAQEGKLDFRSHEYRAIRSSLEQLIRFAHELTLLNFIFTSIYISRQYGSGIRGRSHMASALSSIRDQKTRSEVARCIARAQFAIAFMMIGKSPLTFWLAIIAVAMWKLGGKVPAKLRAFAMPIGEVIQFEAEKSPLNTSQLRPAA